jgi:hypothetical protein
MIKLFIQYKVHIHMCTRYYSVAIAINRKRSQFRKFHNKRILYIYTDGNTVYTLTFFRSIIRQCLISLPTNRPVGPNSEFRSKSPKTLLVRPADNQQLTMSIDKFVLNSSTCYRLCPVLAVGNWLNYNVIQMCSVR